MAGVILAGGRGRRMGGAHKALLEVAGVRLIDRLLGVMWSVFDEVVVSAREAGPLAGLGAPVVLDRMAPRSSLTGIHAGLCGVKAEHAFNVACDVPFLRPDLVRALLAELAADPEADVVIPLKDDGYMEPLFAIYSKRCLPHIEAQLERGDCKIIRFFDKVRVRRVELGRLRHADPDLLWLHNLNTPEELDRARRLAAERDV